MSFRAMRGANRLATTANNIMKSSSRVRSAVKPATFSSLVTQFATPLPQPKMNKKQGFCMPPFAANLSTTPNNEDKTVENDSSASSGVEESSGEEEEAINTKRRRLEEVEAQLDEMQKEIDKKKEENDNLLLAVADRDNRIRRSTKEMEAARKFANQRFVKDLLDVSDNLTRALSNSKDTADFNILFEGVEMTQKGLKSVFGKHNVVEYCEVGDEFDPHKQEAMFNTPKKEGESTDGKTRVSAVLKTGFMYNDRVVRPAQVGTK